MMNIPSEFLKRIPKADLHVHLDGSLRLSTLIELAKKEGVELPAYTEEGLREKVFKDKYASLVEYLKGFFYTGAVMRNAANIERVAYELGQDALAEGVRYLEVRFAPQLHASDTLSAQDAVRAVVRGLKRAQDEHNASSAVKNGEDLEFYFGVIACAMRNFNEFMSPYYANLIKALSQSSKSEIFGIASLELAKMVVKLAKDEHLPVVGFDLAGEEAGYPAADHLAAYRYVHKHFIRKTVHSGEAYGPESIFQAITDCYANRLGHGTHLFAAAMIKDKRVQDKEDYVNSLADYIASERIGIEVCLTSNLQTLPEIKSVKDHPIKEMIKRGLPVSINTDNRLVSNTTVTKEMELLVHNVDLAPKELKNIVIAGFKSAFFPGSYVEKRRFVRKVIDRYNALAREYNIPLY
ncbi:adenosine deaminase family protein [Candidatus Avelusimicrobium stercoris]|uniref:adenosine deaminase family protein n=1 Tax=Candidatus Avelusimicrobium stercoris TaxID=1947924 RepID=UPI003D138001